MPDVAAEGALTARGIKPWYVAWTPEHDALMAELYPTKAPMAEIVERTGHPLEAVYKRAIQLGLKRPKGWQAGGRKLGANSSKALELAARPDGVNAAEMGINSDAASKAFHYLQTAGMLFRGALGNRTVRYFTTQAAADRYVAANFVAHVAKQAPKSSRAGWGPDDPAVITPQTKFTYAPSPPAMVFRTSTHSR